MQLCLGRMDFQTTQNMTDRRILLTEFAKVLRFREFCQEVNEESLLLERRPLEFRTPVQFWRALDRFVASGRRTRAEMSRAHAAQLLDCLEESRGRRAQIQHFAGSWPQKNEIRKTFFTQQDKISSFLIL